MHVYAPYWFLALVSGTVRTTRAVVRTAGACPANTTCTPRSTIVAHGYMHARVNDTFLDTYLTAEHSGADALRIQTSYLQLQATAMV